MKRYTVIIQPEAEVDLRDAFAHIQSESPGHAAAWLAGLYDAVESLETMPNRCGFARERPELNADVRQYVYHSHRILFTVERRRVIVHHIRHAKRDAIKSLSGSARTARRRKRS